MPRIKPKGAKKMLKLNNLQELAIVKMAVPEEAFTSEPKLEVPDGAFDVAKKPVRGEYAAYVYRLYNKSTKREYVTFTFIRSTLKKYFPKFSHEDRFELVQGKVPHNDWFMLRKPVARRGNKVVSAGAAFHTTQYFDAEKMEKGQRYPLELVFKDGALYAKLPQELVPLLRKG